MASGAKNNVGGIVLCGGRSSRMGQPKARLPFGDETMLQRVVRLLSDVVDPIVVVAAPDQELPALSTDVRIVRDLEEGLGPLAGITAGLTTLGSIVDAAYVSSCDVPLLKKEFVHAVIERLGNSEIAVPREDRFHHPLAAVYRTALADRSRKLLKNGQRRPLHLIDVSDSHEFDVDDLRAVDPELLSLQNANTTEEYRQLLTIAGFESDEIPKEF